MAQLVMCIRADSRGLLQERAIYTTDGEWTCKCGLVFLHLADLHIPREWVLPQIWGCRRCEADVDHPDGARLWNRNRFIPLNDPKLDEKPEEYSEMDHLARALLIKLGGNMRDSADRILKRIYGPRGQWIPPGVLQECRAMAEHFERHNFAKRFGRGD